ncbi:hypothetical protein ANN_22604 [Periplaneta americana]|uniref:Uncharacterized protein n=1 Tax=Periplaneta americana TaxID=6978 RepID=A0ABQ8S8Y1_PERAM|nr:hypothetical protein ANN_22604 [Periplaneta americana]
MSSVSGSASMITPFSRAISRASRFLGKENHLVASQPQRKTGIVRTYFVRSSQKSTATVARELDMSKSVAPTTTGPDTV